MLIFKAPGDFCNFRRRPDRGPKRVEKRHPEDPPKTHSKMETEIQETLRRLYIYIYKLVWHPLPSLKIDFENSGGSKNCKNPNARKGARCSKETAPGRNRQTLRFPIVSLLLGRADPPEGRQRGQARRATAGQPKGPIAK